MGSDSGQSCCTGGKSKVCGFLFKILIVGLLTCIASSLWEIEKALILMAKSGMPNTSSK